MILMSKLNYCSVKRAHTTYIKMQVAASGANIIGTLSNKTKQKHTRLYFYYVSYFFFAFNCIENSL